MSVFYGPVHFGQGIFLSIRLNVVLRCYLLYDNIDL